MNNELAVKLDPNGRSDAERQQTLEKLVFNPNKPDPELWRTIIPMLEKEPVVWIQQLEVRLLKKLPFSVEFISSALSLLNSATPSVRLEAAGLIRQVLDRLVFEKGQESLDVFERELLLPLLSHLKRNEIITQPSVWIELYKMLGSLSGAPAVSEAMVALLPKGNDAALFVFAQYVHAKYPENCLNPLLEGFSGAKSDDTALHLVRALNAPISKEGALIGYANTEPVIQVLVSALKSKSENVRREAASVLASRAKIAAKEKTRLPLEDEAWDALFTLYDERLSDTSARDKNEANTAIMRMPITQARLTRLFEVMHRVQDEMEKQNVVGLIGSFKTADSRVELLRLLRENFAGLRLEAQKVTINAVSSYMPDEEVEAELDKLLEGKGLHSDILSTLGDKLFAPLPSLKNRLMKWLSLNEKTKRPLIEQFALPMMHIKIIQAAKILSGDADIKERLLILEPLLMMNDAKVKLHEVLRAFPSAPAH